MSDKEKILKAARKKRYFVCRGTQVRITPELFLETMWEDSGVTSLMNWKEKTANLEFYPHCKYLSKLKIVKKEYERKSFR